MQGWMMPDFEARGIGRETRRRRKRVYRAYDEGEARQMAEADGIVVGRIQMLPDEPATESQLSYARDLGLSIPENATKDELRDMLSCHLEHDKPASERHKLFAKAYRVHHTRFVGKRVLFNMIFATLQARGHERQLVSWFAYRVYRELVHGAADAPIAGPDDPVIQGVTDELVNDTTVLDSIKRYVGSDLIWFGEWTAPDHTVHTGGSNHTIAYKRTSQLLRDKLHLHTRGSSLHPDISPPVLCAAASTNTPRHTLVILLLVIVLSFILFLFIVYAH